MTQRFTMSGRFKAPGYGGAASTAAPSAPRLDLDQVAQQMIAGVRNGQAPDVARRVGPLLKQFPDHLGLLQVMVEVETARGDFKSSNKYAERMVKAAPHLAMPRILLAASLRKVFRNAEALKALTEAERLAGDDVMVLSMVAHTFEKMDAMQDAFRVLERVNALAPNRPELLQRLAAVRRFLGDLETAEADCDRAIANGVGDHHVYYLRSGLRKQTRENNHTEELEAVLAAGRFKSPRDRIHVQYALAKEYEDLGEWDASFRHLKAVSDFQRRQMDYDVKGDIDTMRDIARHFDRAFFERRPEGHDEAGPIFIVGMPRTGTTLVERIVGSHSAVLSLGELGVFPRLMVRGVKDLVGSMSVAPEDRVRLTAALDFRKLGASYLAGVRERRGQEAYFIDKLPYNFLNVGPICAALPQAKVIQLDRHPMDTCYAIYKQLFGTAYPFSYTLEELGEYYCAYRRLMDHWTEVLPEGRLLRIRYEDVVADQEAETRKIFEYCNLAWEDQVKEFYKSEQSSTTASAAQIRQPIYKSSVEKWRRYETHLAPLRAVLEAHGITGLD